MSGLKEAGLRRAKGLLKKIAKPPHGEVKIHPEDDAVKVLTKAGYTESEAWGKVVDELENLKLRYGSSPILGVSPKRISEAYANADRSKDYFSSKKNLNRYLGVIAAAFIGGSFAFFTPNVTGHAIWNLPFGNTNSVGAVLFVLGLSGMFFSLRKK